MSTTKINLLIWIPVQTLNFLFVPVNVIVLVIIHIDYQILVINIVNLFWNCYLSIVANRQVSYSKVNDSAKEDYV